MFKKKFVYVLSFLIFAVFTIFFGFSSGSTVSPNMLSVANGSACPDFFEKVVDFFKGGLKKEEAVAPIVEESVYVSGYPIGFSIETNGVVVVSLGEIYTNNGYVESPSKKAGIKEGDIIVMVEDSKVSGSDDLINAVNEIVKHKSTVNITLNRNGEERVVVVEPYLDDLANAYRLGLWVRDSAIGVGTLTYIKKDGTFGALGHPVTDADTNTIMPVGNGKIYRCSIIDVKKGVKGAPGELKGLFLKSSSEIGIINENKQNGIGGKFCDQDDVQKYTYKEVGILSPNKVKAGKVKVISTIDGGMPSEYDAEIIKTNYAVSGGAKCMVIKITDSRLLSETGGIVQGMSGSPVVQDGKLIGCITHVFINDPTKGFVEYIV